MVSRLRPTFAKHHEIDDEEAEVRLQSALKGRLWELLLTTTWEALNDNKRRPPPDAILERVAESLKERPYRPGRQANVTPAFSAFLLLVDLEAGTASDAARKLLESATGEVMKQQGLAEAGRFLAEEFVR
jgi:hypothetical protein